MKNNRYVFYVLIAASLWGTMGAWVHIFDFLGYTQYHLAAFRSIVTAILLLGYLAIFKREELRVKLYDLPIFFAGAIISVVIFNCVYFTSIKLGTMSLAATLLYTSPIFVMIFSAIIFKEKITLKKVIALTVSVGGCVLVSGVFNSSVNLPAIITGIAAGLTYGLYSIFSKLALRKYSPITYTAYTALIAAVILIFISDFGKACATISTDWLSVPLIILFSAVTNIIPYLLFNKSLQYLEAGKVSIIATVEPVVASIIGLIFFNEKLTLISVLGIVLVLSGSFILNIKKPLRK